MQSALKFDLRHTFGTTALESERMEVVRSLMRHEKLETTQTYAKVRGRVQGAAHMRVQARIAKSMSTASR